MEIEGCDCSEFERREGYIPCESLIAGQISALKGRLMSPDLIEMDRKEYEVFKIEEADLKTFINLEWKNVQQPQIKISQMLLVASMIGLYFGITLDRFAISCLSVAVGIISVLRMLTSGVPTLAQYNKILDIDDNRLSRLRNKVEVLDAKISTASESKEELRSAKDFFKTKYDLYLGLRHRPITNVVTYQMHSTYKKA
jgi:hypothetical protein